MQYKYAKSYASVQTTKWTGPVKYFTFEFQ
jgi:hypothetical protein